MITKWYAFYALAPVVAMLIVSLWPKHKWQYSFSRRTRKCVKCGCTQIHPPIREKVWITVDQGNPAKHSRNKYKIVGMKK